MKDLLRAIQSELMRGLDPDVFRIADDPEQSDIFISEAELILPPVTNLPAVGVLMGPQSLPVEHACGGSPEMTKEVSDQTVFVIIWASALGQLVGGGVIGTDRNPGVSDTEPVIYDILRHNSLGMDGFRDVARGAILAPRVTLQEGNQKAMSLAVPYIYQMEKTYEMRRKYI